MLTEEERAALRQELKDGGIVGDHQRETIIDILEPRLAQTVTREQMARACCKAVCSEPECVTMPCELNATDSPGSWFFMQADAILALLGRPSDQKENT